MEEVVDKNIEKDEDIVDGDPEETIEDENVSLGPRSLNGGTRVWIRSKGKKIILIQTQLKKTLF